MASVQAPARAGVFDVGPLIGRGSSGVVHRAIHAPTGLAVAVKLLPAPRDADDLAAFRDEVRAAAWLDHPNVVRLYDHGLLPDGRPWLAMELATGGTLRGWRPRSFRELAGTLVAVLDGLGHAHARGVLHLDLSAANVLVCAPADRRPGPKVADFGLARRGGSAPSGGGTILSMAPEQFDAGRAGPASDLYAVGCLAFELACGFPAFAAGDPMAVVFAKVVGRRVPFQAAVPVPPGFERWIDRLVDPDPARRFELAADAVSALVALPSEGMALPEHPPDWRPPGFQARPPRLLDSGLGLLGARRPTLLGRERERDRLWALLGAARADGEPRVAVLEGEGGVGKSALAEWLCERSEETGTARAVRAGRPRGTSPEERARSLRASVEAAGRAVVVWLDDAPEDLDGLDAAGRLARGGGVPALLVLTARSDSLVASPDARAAIDALVARGAARIAIDPLPPVERAILVEDLLGLRSDVAGRVVRHAAGNPLATVSLVRSWAERGMLASGPDGFVLVSEPGPVAAGGAPAERVRSALAGLGAAERETAELLAVLGDPVQPADWAAACAAHGLPSPAAVRDALLECGLLRSRADGLRFSHGLLRDAVLCGVPQDRLRLLHEAAADALAGGDPGVEGEHRLAAGQPGAAAGLLREAALACTDAADHRGSLARVDSWERALDALSVGAAERERVELLVVRAGALRGLARFVAAEEVGRLALAAARASGWEDLVAGALVEVGRCALNLGRLPEAADLLGLAAVAAASSGFAQVEACALRMLGLTRLFEGRLEEAAAQIERARLAYLALSNPLRAAWCAVGRSQVEKQAGRLDQVARWLEEAADLGAGNDALLAEVANGLGEVARLRLRLDDAERHYRRVLHWAVATGGSDRPVAEANLGLVLLERGAWADARQQLLPAREEFGRHGRRDLAATVDLALAACAGGLRDWPEWDSRLDAARRGLAETGFVYFDVARTARIAADLAARRGDPARAAVAAALAREQFRALGRDDDAGAVAG